MSEITTREYLLRKLVFWSPVIFRGHLWVMLAVLGSFTESLMDWQSKFESGKWTAVPNLSVWIAILRAAGAGYLACRVFLDQTYSRHVIDNAPNGSAQMPSAKETETAFIKRSIEEAQKPKP